MPTAGSTTIPTYNTVSKNQAIKSTSFVNNKDQGLIKGSAEDKSLANLRQQLIAAESQYNAYFKVLKDKAQNYFDRVDPKKDSYLNTNIIFENGTNAYVTNQGVVKTYPTGQLNNIKGKNDCPSSSLKILKTNDVTTLIPHLKDGTSMIQNQQCGNEGKNIMVSSILPSNMPEPTYKGCYASNSNQKMSYIDINGNPTASLPSKEAQRFTYDDCKTAAIYNGYRYFGVQNAGPNGNGEGYCAVSNSIVPFTEDNTSYIVSGTTALWKNSNMDNFIAQELVGAQLQFNNHGALMVLNQTGDHVIFTTQSGNNFVGCYQDSRGDIRQFATIPSASFYKNQGIKDNYLDYNLCSQYAELNGYTYFALQNEQNGTKNGMNPGKLTGGGSRLTRAECRVGMEKDFSDANNKKYFPSLPAVKDKSGAVTSYTNGSQSCKQSPFDNGRWYGGGSANAVYKTGVGSTGNYFLLVQDNGNFGVYKGDPPRSGSENLSNVTSTLFESKTGGKAKDPDPQYAASKSKYGNCISVSTKSPSVILKPGEFIGSLSGKAYLKMENTGPNAGYLVLYTSTRKVNCNLDNQKHMVGGVGTNAVYDITKAGVPQDLGMAGFVDENSVLHQYPSSMISYPKSNSNYVTSDGNPVSVTRFNITSHTVTGNLNTSTYKSLAEAQKACNNNPKCNSILKADTAFYLTTNKYGEPTEKDNKAAVTTYYRVPQINTSGSCPKGVMGVDSLTWERYKNNGGGLGSQMSPNFDCTFGQANITEDPTLLALKKKVEDLRRQILEKTKSWSGRSHVANQNHIGNKSEETTNALTHSTVVNNKDKEKDETSRKTLNASIKQKQVDAIKNAPKKSVTTKEKYGQIQKSTSTHKKIMQNNKGDMQAASSNINSSTTTTRQGFTNMNSVINRIVNDSSIQVSQRNYEYILWIVLAIIAIAICIRVYRVKAKA